MKRFVWLLAFAMLCLCVGCAEGSVLSGESEVSEPASASEPEASVASEETVSEPEAPDPLFTLVKALSECDPTYAEEDFLRFVCDTVGEEAFVRLSDTVGDGSAYEDSVWRACTGNSKHALYAVYTKEPERLPNVVFRSLGTPGSEKQTTLVFGGDICFADDYLTVPYMRAHGLTLAECISAEYASVLEMADLSVLNNEFTISDRGSPLPGKMWTFRSKTENTAFYRELGIDLVTLANNHAYDYGKDAFLDTLDTLDAYGIPRVGAGRDDKEAQLPVYFIQDGRKIAFVSATRAEKFIMTPEATANTPGVFRCYDPTRLLEVLTLAKEESDYVVLLVHWGTEHSTVLEPVQKETAPLYLDAGADLIVGGHAHGLQGIERFANGTVFYNLGNFWFDSYRIETALLQVTLSADGEETFRVLPGLTNGCLTTYELGTPIGERVLQHLCDYSEQEISFAQDGTLQFPE